MSAYNKLYVARAQKTMGSMLDFAVCVFGMQLSTFWDAFLRSGLADRFGAGDPQTVVGKSGVELAWLVFEHAGIAHETSPDVELDMLARSPEYWTGWALCRYQWLRGIPFSQIQDFVPIDDIALMYSPFHEMDISQFCDELDRRIAQQCPDTRLARRRKALGLSQSELALLSGVSVRSIQHYEQRKKDINRASVSQVVNLARALRCDVEDLLDPLGGSGVG